MREETKKYLLKKEWSMGNGQCPECCGCPESWLGHPLHLDSSNLGHKKDCVLAKMLEEQGIKPLYIGDSKLTEVYESYISEYGAFSTRLKTKNGCPKLKKINKEFSDKFWASMSKSLFEESKTSP